MSKELIEKVIKGIAIASGGGGIAIGSGKLNLTDIDFPTTVTVVAFSIAFNTLYQIVKRLIPETTEKK